MLATFYVNAFNRGDITIEPFRSILRRAYNEGHQIASHSYDHLDLAKLDIDGIWAQAYRNDKAIEQVLGVMPTYFRPPYGSVNDLVLTALGSWGYQVVWQNIDSLDFLYGGQPNAIALMETAYSWSLGGTSAATTSFISLQHDFVQETVDTWTQMVITKFTADGYRFVTSGECLGNPNPSSWYRASPWA
jgi:peptidoglycan/xylan/chitin deacetylase (PgdA/CDA1 family)